MTNKLNVNNALLGALVADAASMGLHWLYDQKRLAEIAKAGEILFIEPHSEHYEGVKGYFAHSAKQAGESSQYGEAIYIAAKTSAGGKYDKAKHQAEYLAHFGPGGKYVGYADRIILATVAKLLASNSDDYPIESGIDDDQHPALTAVSALFAKGCMPSAIEAAVKMTNINPTAQAGAQALLTTLQKLADGSKMKEALVAGAEAAGGELAKLLHQALELEKYDANAAAEKFGLPCHIKQGLPVVWHIALHVSDFEQAVKDNLLAGGDNCGRAIALGSLIGLVAGVPLKMAEKTKILHREDSDWQLR